MNKCPHCGGEHFGQRFDDCPLQLAEQNKRLAAEHGIDLETLPPVPTIDARGDYVCKHGVAMDVHCCGCHNGFIFERDHVCEPKE